jgi:2-oxoglutarate ferredoxin oxidoreductase subunit alpha
VLLVGWGSTWGPICEATKRARSEGHKVSSVHIRHLNPLPNGLAEIFEKFDRVCVVELNDQGLYGHGQLATLLRARFCDPKITSLTKTDGLNFRIREILSGIQPLQEAAAKMG